MQDFPPLERPSDVFSYTSFRGSFFEPRLHLSFETAVSCHRVGTQHKNDNQRRPMAWCLCCRPFSVSPRPKTKPSEPQAFSAVGKFTDNLEFADREKKKAFIESITSGQFHNQTSKGAESALSCMMARTAAYTGREVTWDEMLKSTEVWDAKIDLNKLH